MKKVVFFVLLVFGVQNSFGGVFLEPLKGSDRIYRGRAPRLSEMPSMVSAGITSVLIFKNQIKTEVDDEIAQLVEQGIEREKIYNIPFEWKDITSLKKSCEQVVDALKILENIQNSAGDKILFHCTVGEDRTGLLAGLMSQLLASETAESSFANQMCAKGYAGGNPHKPRDVSAEVDRGLTPLYFKMSKLIEEGVLRPGALSRRACHAIDTINVTDTLKTCSKR